VFSPKHHLWDDVIAGTFALALLGGSWMPSWQRSARLSSWQPRKHVKTVGDAK
jgi:hypothetical protein